MAAEAKAPDKAAPAAAENKGGTDQAGPSKIAKLIGPIFFALNLVGVGTGVFFAYKGSIGYHTPVYTEELAQVDLKKDKEQIEEAPFVFTLDPFKANLAGQPVRGIQLNMSVEMLNREGFEQIVNRDFMAQIRDSVMTILNTKTLDEVESVQGKLALKDQIASSLNRILPDGIVKDIYFTKFQVE